MTHSASSRLTAAVAGAVLAVGILAGGAAAAATHTQNMADYGAAITADDAADHARAEGVPHMSDHHRGSGNYFERMNGSDD